MSRCFPFPPSGYEKKARPDDLSLLTKEKHKEKKHKKDKDKQRREGKEKKHKERSEGKHREKKDRKDKHKSRKDKDRDKEKKETSDEKKTAGLECQNGNKPGPNCVQSNETMDPKFLLELGKRIRDNDGATENQKVQKPIVKDQRSAEFSGKVEGNFGNLFEGSDNFKDKRGDDRKVNGQNNRVEARRMENGFVYNFTSGGQKKSEGMAKLVDKNVEKQMEGSEKNKYKNSDNRGDRHKARDQEKKSKSKDNKRKKEKEKEYKANEKQPNTEQLKKRESINNAVDIHNGKPSCPLKESNKNSESMGNPGKRKELEISGILHDNDFRPSKLPRSVSFCHEVLENGRILEPSQTAIHFSFEWEGTVNKMGNKVSSHPVMENGRKFEPGQTALQFASEWQGMVKNHKVSKKVSSSHLIMENGRKLDQCQTTIQLASEGQGMVSNGRIDNKELRVNGLVEAQRPNVCLVRPSSTTVQVKENVEAPRKPPHPDSKYLRQILSVPEIELSDYDDQDWLFSCNNLQAKKSKLDSFQVEGTKEVWAEALWLESADVSALPFVIPY